MVFIQPYFEKEQLNLRSFGFEEIFSNKLKFSCEKIFISKKNKFAF